MEKLQRYFDAIEAELSKIEYAADPMDCMLRAL